MPCAAIVPGIHDKKWEGGEMTITYNWKLLTLACAIILGVVVQGQAQAQNHPAITESERMYK
jgi:hypothetical protein